MINIEMTAKAVLILWFIIAIYFQQDVGLADNGDFTRSMGAISSGPIGIEPNWPAGGTEDWSRRFFNYWIPFWKLELNIVMPTSSAFLLWFPSALLNKFVYSSNVLYLPALSLFPKLILFATLLLLLKWIKIDAKNKTIFLFSLGVPIVLMLTTTDYLAYLNSFYLESVSTSFLFLFFISITLLKQRPSFTYIISSLTFILLLATTKPAYLYWPLLAIPFVFYVWYIKNNVRLRTAVVASIILIILFTSISVFITKTGSIKANPYHSLFYGALTFSDNPSAHLQYLGIDDANECINTVAYSSAGSACLNKYKNQLSFKNTLRVIYKEPLLIIRMLKHVLDNMQDVSLDYLGKYSIDDPRSKIDPRNSNSTVKRYWPSTNEMTLFNLWAKLKFEFFPTGYALFFVIIIFITRLWPFRA